jgi:hypothetical protein
MGIARSPAPHVIDAAKAGARHVVTIHHLADAPLLLDRARNERSSKVARMAAILLRDRSYAVERDAVRSLFGHFTYFEISVLIDDARQVAAQHMVEMEISKP